MPAEIIFASSDPAESRRIRRMLEAKEIRPLMKRVYTRNLTDGPEQIVRQNLHYLLCHLYPGTVLSHRSALNPYMRGNPDFVRTGAVYLTSSYTDKIEWPGVTVRLLKGPEAEAADPVLDPLLPQLRISSFSRAILENMQESRERGQGKKSLANEEIQSWLKVQGLLRGPEFIAGIAAQAQATADRLGMLEEWTKLQGLIAAALKGKGRSGFRWRHRIAREFPDQGGQGTGAVRPRWIG